MHKGLSTKTCKRRDPGTAEVSDMRLVDGLSPRQGKAGYAVPPSMRANQTAGECVLTAVTTERGGGAMVVSEIIV